MVIWVAIWAAKRTPVMRAERCALAISAVACARAMVRTSESFPANRESRLSIVVHSDSSTVLEMKNLS